MLVDTMSPSEITAEVLGDHDIVKKSWERLANEYDRERRRLKVDKNVEYKKIYEIKSAKKNKWIFIFHKSISFKKYAGIDTLIADSLIYYYNTSGLRVFNIYPDGVIAVFNGHLFKRYNERMQLGLEKPIDWVKHFFMNNSYSAARSIFKEGKENIVTVCKEGLLLGEVQENGKWYVQKTFITKELQRSDQDEMEKELINILSKEIIREINKPRFDSESLQAKLDFLKDIT